MPDNNILGQLSMCVVGFMSWFNKLYRGCLIVFFILEGACS